MHFVNFGGDHSFKFLFWSSEENFYSENMMQTGKTTNNNNKLID